MSSTILPKANPSMSKSPPITIPYFPAYSDAIAQTAIPTVAPKAQVGRYSFVNGR